MVLNATLRLHTDFSTVLYCHPSALFDIWRKTLGIHWTLATKSMDNVWHNCNTCMMTKWGHRALRFLHIWDNLSYNDRQRENEKLGSVSSDAHTHSASVKQRWSKRFRGGGVEIVSCWELPSATMTRGGVSQNHRLWRARGGADWGGLIIEIHRLQFSWPFPRFLQIPLYQPGHKGALFAFKSESKSSKNMHPCVEADTEECTHFESRG